MRIVVMVPPVQDGVYDYRLRFPLTELGKRGEEVLWANSPEEAWPLLTRGADLLVMTRPADAESMILVTEAQKVGVKVVVDLDDVVHEISHHNPYYVVWGSNLTVIQQWLPILKDNVSAFHNLAWTTEHSAKYVHELAIGRLLCLEACLKNADLVTFSTPFLLRYYTRRFPEIRSATVIANAVPGNIMAQGDRPRTPRDYISLRWAGSLTHHDDLLELQAPLRALATMDLPAWKLELCGLSDYGYQLFPDLRARMDSQPAMPHDEYALWHADADIVLAPSSSHPFNRGKSDLRILYAGYYGVPVVASSVTYGATVTRARMGLVVHNGSQWVSSLQSLILDSSRREELGRNGLVYVRSQRTIEQRYTAWQEAYRHVIANGAGHPHNQVYRGELPGTRSTRSVRHRDRGQGGKRDRYRAREHHRYPL